MAVSDAIAVMKTAVTQDANCWNGRIFYRIDDYSSIQLLYSYFTGYPEDNEKVVVSIKGPIRGDEYRHTVDKCLKLLDGKKALDTFRCARVDPKIPIKETVHVQAQYITKSELGGISSSDGRAENIRRAASVHSITCYEV